MQGYDEASKVDSLRPKRETLRPPNQATKRVSCDRTEAEPRDVCCDYPLVV